MEQEITKMKQAKPYDYVDENSRSHAEAENDVYDDSVKEDY